MAVPTHRRVLNAADAAPVSASDGHPAEAFSDDVPMAAVVL
jgi:hypothetical protein